MLNANRLRELRQGYVGATFPTPEEAQAKAVLIIDVLVRECLILESLCSSSLRAVADAARVGRARMRALPERTIQELHSLGLPELAMQHLSMALDALEELRLRRDTPCV